MPETQPALSSALAAAVELLTAIEVNRERRLLWLAGGEAWTLAAANAIACGLGITATRWLGNRSGPTDPNRRTAGLGGECGLLLVDAWAGLDLDAVGAAVGTLRGGGLMVLLTPPAMDWPTTPDPAAARFASAPHSAAEVTGRTLRRLRQLLRAHPAVHRLHEPAPAAAHGSTPTAYASAPAATVPEGAQSTPSPDPWPELTGALAGALARAPARLAPATPDQAAAVDAILATARGRARRALVMTADRGRGKSAAMGLASAQLSSRGSAAVLLTAPRRGAADAVLRHAGAAAPRYLAPDALLAQRPAADLLLVDEAAAIPAPLLEAMLRHWPRIVFATTVHGYEGTGRGFDVRFRGVLDQLTPGWQALRLHQPIRWAQADPLEAFVNRALLLDAEPATDAQALAAAHHGLRLDVDTADRDRLAQDEPLLRQAFGLLVLSHYQTRPSDLRQLLDAPGIAVHLLRAGETVLATAVSGREGRLPEALLMPIFAGRRRPRGHLLPQTLSAHAGLFEAPALACRRILRIAVHPALRRRGLGRQLVAGIAAQAAAGGDDLIGASFGATPALLAFWHRCGLEPVHLGSRQNAASGAHAAVLLQALTPAGAIVHQRGREGLLPRLAVLLGGPLRGLDPSVVAGVLRGAPPVGEPLSDDERRELDAFAGAARGLDATRPALHRLLQLELTQALASHALTPAQASALIACGLQLREPGAAAPLLAAAGADSVVRILRQAVTVLMGQPSSPDHAGRIA